MRCLDRAAADAGQLRYILDGMPVHVVLQDGALRAGQRFGAPGKALQPRLHLRRQRPRRPFADGSEQLVDLRDTGGYHLRRAASDRRQQQGVFLPQTRCLQRAFQLRKQAFFHA